MFKDYYEILGLDRFATEKEIKQSFRSLAIVYHPDSNDHPEAHQKFLDLNEAYQVLSDERRKIRYDEQYDYVKLGRQSMVHRPDLRYKYKESTGPSTYATPPRKSRAEEFGRYSPYAKLVAWIGLLFSLSLVLDYFLADHSTIQTVKAGMLTEGPGGELSGFIHTEDYQFLLDYKHFEHLGKGDKISLRQTPIYEVITHLYVWESASTVAGSGEVRQDNSAQMQYGPTFSFFPHYGIFNVFSFFLVGLIVLSLVGVAISKRPEFLFKLGLLNLMMLLITIFVLLNS